MSRRTLSSVAFPSALERTYFAGVSEPLTVKETVAKDTGSDVFESMRRRLTENVFCADAKMLTKRARKKVKVLIECFIIYLDN